MKMKQKGIATAAIAVIVVVVVVVAVAAAYFLVLKPKQAGRATATVRLHDTEDIDISDWMESYIPDIPGVTISAWGTVTVNSFSATNITVKLHHKDNDEWITIIENQTITDLTIANDLVEEISSGTYDKVSVYIGTVSVGVSWSDIVISYTIDLSPYGGVGTFSENYTQPAGSFNQSITINQELVIDLEPDVIVDAGENQVFDVDTGAPFDIDSTGSGMTQGFDFDAGELELANMKARGL